ncbi:DinB family protein [Roseivirga pacifica]
MNKVEIKARLEEAYSDFLKFIDGLSADEFDYAPEGKWNAGQQAIHLIKSTKPLVKALGLPKFLLKQQFGKTNREGRNYEQVVERYKEKLATTTMEAPAKFKPEASSHKDFKKLCEAQRAVIDKIQTKLNKWTEEEMDEYVLPHPLMGKVTVREMMYFSIYHAGHHQNLVKLYLKGV